MTNEELIYKIIEELSIPAGQGWVTLDELVERAKELDDKNRRND